MNTLSLRGIKVFAYHGVYPEEQVVGCWFTVDVKIQLKKEKIAHFGDSVDYTQVLSSVEHIMKIPRKTIEEVTNSIAGELKEKYQQISKVRICVSKDHLPMNAGKMSVRYCTEI